MVGARPDPYLEGITALHGKNQIWLAAGGKNNENEENYYF